MLLVRVLPLASILLLYGRELSVDVRLGDVDLLEPAPDL
jgi:hypothetical protein